MTRWKREPAPALNNPDRYISSDITWSEKQRIKNEIFGEERLAIEVFPAKSNLVNEVNMYHLWVMPKGFSLPFGLKDEEHQVANIPSGIMPHFKEGL